MRLTVLLLSGDDPGACIAFVPGPDVVTQGEGIEGALTAACETPVLATEEMMERGEEALTEPKGAIVGAIDVDTSVPVGTSA